jgi:hypothetical protein
MANPIGVRGEASIVLNVSPPLNAGGDHIINRIIEFGHISDFPGPPSSETIIPSPSVAIMTPTSSTESDIADRIKNMEADELLNLLMARLDAEELAGGILRAVTEVQERSTGGRDWNYPGLNPIVEDILMRHGANAGKSIVSQLKEEYAHRVLKISNDRSYAPIVYCLLEILKKDNELLMAIANFEAHELNVRSSGPSPVSNVTHV